MKVLWHSNAPWSPTGYGQQTGLFTPLLKEHHDVTISSFYGLDGAPLEWSGIQVLPGIPQDFGNMSLWQHAEEVFGARRDGLLFTLMDVWVLDSSLIKGLNAACWVPVDHDPCPPAVIDFFANSDAIPICMARFGQEQLARFNPLYVPHGVDTEVYKPEDRSKVREALDLDEDAFVIGMAAANKGRPSRKAFSEAFQGVAPIIRENENAYLYLHTIMEPSHAAGENIPKLLDALEIPRDRVRVTNQYRNIYRPFPPDAMSRLFYNALDVLINPSWGEGFGITPLEAQACGVPVVVGDNTAQREVCGAGWQVEGRRVWTGQNSWQHSPLPEDITSALEECRTLPAAQRASLKTAARQHALKYDAKRVCKEFLLPSLRQVELRLEARRPVTIAPRKAVAA